MKKIILYLFLLPLILYNYCSAQTKGNKRLEKEFGGISTIEISTISGNCNIKKTNGQAVRVTLEYNYKPAKNFEPVFSQKGNLLILKEEMPGSNSGHSDWSILVPEQIDIKFNSASGGIILENIKGKININTASGNIVASGIKITDNSEFNSASGSVIVTLDESPKFNVSVSSASGNATLDYHQNPVIGNIEMKARVSLGKIKCPFKFDKEIELEKDFGDQKYMVKTLKVQQGSPSIKIYTASGTAILIK